MVPAEGTEISVRFKLPVAGAAYNFGAKFGATSELAVDLLKTVAAAGYIPSLTFHPGTQCRSGSVGNLHPRSGGHRPHHRAAECRRRLSEPPPAGDRPADRDDVPADRRVATEAFGADRPLLVWRFCGDAFALAARVKALRDGTHVFLNDGVYGALTATADDRRHRPDGGPHPRG